MEKIAGYILHEKIRETRNSFIYRGQKENQPQSLIIKVLKTKYPTPSEIARFKQEYNLIKDLTIDGIIKIYAIVQHNNSFAIIEEDFGGISMKEILKTKKLGLKEFLRIAATLSRTLGLIHKNNIIHLDIKPDNILINAKLDTVKIADFGISVALTHANDEIYNPEVVSGTLAYMSPEQTGRMNRNVDYRTDLYSLGVTFYEMISGEVPFKSQDPMELIHSHIARQPAPPRGLDSSVPQVVSAIIMKLLSKTPEERYQNGLGLAADIEKCLDQFTKRGRIDNFALGKKDISIKFYIPQIIVGRKKELNILLESFEQASSGTSGIMLVLGQPGIGKSALINEIYKPIVARKGYFIFGKYDQFRRDVPYSSIIQAFQGLIRQILSESEEKIETWKNKLISVLGNNGKVIISVMPELEHIIGEQPDVPDLNPEESRYRLNLVFQNFINVFTTEDHPLAIFLDDLQWADIASLKLIKTIITSPESKYLFLIGAYRDNEVSQYHPLIATLEEIRKGGRQIQSISLGPLNAPDVNAMIMNVLRCKAEKSFYLAELIYRKTAGNPFFVNQFLKNLYDSRVLELDPKTGWIWDIRKIEQMHVTENVVEFMAQKISTLPENTQEILKICACIGNRFDLESLSVVSGKSIDETLTVLTSAVQEGLVSVYADMYRFHHDRIQEAAYSLIPDNEKVKMHYRIGNNVLQKTRPKDLNARIFYIVDQLNRGTTLVIDYDERVNLMNLNLAAAAKAKNSAAFATSADYFEMGKSLLSAEEWAAFPQRLFELSIQYAECIFLSGYIERASGLCDRLFQLATNNLEKGSVYNLKAQIIDFLGEKRELVIDIIRKGLQLFGMSLPEDNQEIDRKIGEGIGKMQENFTKIPIEELVNLPQMKDEDKIMAMNLLFQAIPAAIQSYPPLFILIVLMMFDLAMSHGTTAISSKNFADCGMIQGSILGDYDAGYRLGQAAFAIINKYKADSLKSSVYFVFSAFISHWRVHYQESLDYYDLSYQSGLQTGDIHHVAYSCAHKVHRLFYIGRNLEECKRETENAIVLLDKSKAVIQLFVAQILLHSILKLQTIPGRNKETDSVKKDNDMLEEAKASNIFSICMFGQCNTMTNYLLDNMEAAEKWNAFTEPFIQGGIGYFPLPDHFLFQSLILIRKWKTATADEQKNIMENLLKKQEKLKNWSDNCPSNFSHKYYLLSAEIAVMREEPQEIITDLYKKAVDSIGEDDFIHMRALANELQGNFFLEKGHKTIGKALIQEAYNLYKQWGALAKVKNLEGKFSNLFFGSYRKTGSGSITDTDTTISFSGTTGLQSLDLTAVIKTSQSLSSEIDLGNLLVNIMKLSIENAGAQHGYLILINEDDKKLYIEATGRIEGPIEVLKSIPVEGNDSLAVTLVQYVNKTGENIVLGDAAGDKRFMNDPYITAKQPKSILCTPIRHKGKTNGILYLENNLATETFTPQRIELLQIFSAQAAISIENTRLISQREKTAKLQTEMQIAANIQSSLLPEDPMIPGFEITTYLKPTDEVGGDYYDIINIGDFNWLIIGDVSGHGVPAGLVMMMVQTAIQTQVRKYPDTAPSELLSMVNEVIRYNVKKMKSDKYMTITAFSFTKDGKAVYSGLHQDILVYRASTDETQIIHSAGIWLSPWDMGQKNIDNEVKLKRGDIMLLFTDGITEARNAEGTMFSRERLAGILKKFGKFKSYEIKNKILEDIQGYKMDDDATMVILKKL